MNPDYRREGSAKISQDGANFQAMPTPQRGYIVYFPPGQVPYLVTRRNDTKTYPGHVAIMLSATQFVGMQSNGLGKVTVPDVWWWSRPRKFYRYIGKGFKS